MYTDTYQTWLDRCEKRDATGWPAFVTPEAEKWLVRRVKEALTEYGPLPLRELYRLAWKRHDDQPECLRGAVLWDAIYGTLHRAALAAGAQETWTLQ